MYRASHTLIICYDMVTHIYFTAVGTSFSMSVGEMQGPSLSVGNLLVVAVVGNF